MQIKVWRISVIFLFFVVDTSSILFSQEDNPKSKYVTWVSTDGKKIEAEFIELHDNGVVIRTNGKLFTVPLSRLSEESVVLAEQLGRYKLFASALDGSATEVNKTNFTDAIYKCDTKSAEEFFTKYFKENYLSPALRANLGYPLFSWGDNHTALQHGIISALMKSLKEIFGKYKTPLLLEQAMAAKPELFDHIFYSIALVHTIAEQSKVLKDEGYRELCINYLDLMRSSTLFKDGYVYRKPEQWSYVNPIVSQLLLTGFKLSTRVDEIDSFVSLLQLDPSRKQIVLSGVLIVDNKQFDTRQIEAIREFVGSVPKTTSLTLSIQCVDLSLNPKNSRVNVHSFAGGVNIFAGKIGDSHASNFPADYNAVVESDEFCVVLAHEYAHALDAVTQRRNPDWARYRAMLLKLAGREPKNYLRSMFDSGFFEATPQEFVASIANEYCSSSQHTFLYAMKKYEEGNLNQINQFVMIATCFSDDDHVAFLEIDKNGHTTVKNHACTKSNGLINSISFDETRYDFHFVDGLVDRIDQVAE